MRTPVFLLMALLVASSPASAAPVRVLEVLDGDTFIIQGEWAVMNGRKVAFRVPGTVKVRVSGIDTPELPSHAPRCRSEGERGVAARAFAERLLSGAVRILRPSHDKYGGRINALVTVDGRDYASAMIAAGHAQPYTGEGSRPNWCG